MEMITLQVEVPAEIALRINGNAVVGKPAEWHASWLTAVFVHGARRKPNDDNSGLSGPEKEAAIREYFKAMAEPKPARGTGTSVAAHDPITTLALKTAKAALTANFQKATGLKTQADMCAASERVAAYFKPGTTVWNDQAVIDWMADQKAKGKTDYMADAAAALAEDDGDF